MVMEAEKSRPRKADDIVVAHTKSEGRRDPYPSSKQSGRERKKHSF